ncbi:hypothetical protein CIB48_g5429 [Xylaria polymorpha]|nr:hypothetical protein CIB48_g5429 [Xylaria polymorpha]
MCFHQNIHAAFHYRLLGFDAREREGHECSFQCPTTSCGKTGLKDVGEKCPLHSCCWVRTVVVVRCCEAIIAEESDWEYGGGDGRLCSSLFVEDVFVPLPDRGAGNDNDIAEFPDPINACASDTSETNTAQRAGETTEPVMEFWPEDGAPREVLVLPDEMVSQDGGRLASFA